MERGRTNHLRLMGAEQHALFEQAQSELPGFAFVLRSMHIDFLKPARMDDVLDIVTSAGRGEGRFRHAGRRKCGVGTTCWSRPRCGWPSSARAGRSRSRNRCGCC